MKRLHFPSLLLGALLCAIAVATPAIAARNREVTSLGSVEEICFKPNRAAISVVDAGSGGELQANAQPTGWRWTAIARYHATGASNREEPAALCAAGDAAVGAQFKNELEALLTSRVLSKIAGDCKAP